MAGVLVFDHPESYLPHANVRIKMGALQERVEGNLPEQVDKTVEKILSLIPREEVRAGVRRQRKEDRELWRELVVNALVHRNYAIYSEVFIEIKGLKVVIKNPGGFPPGFDIRDPKPMPRNPLVYEAMHLLGYVEKEGSGIEMVREIAKALGYKVEWRERGLFTEVSVEIGGIEERDREILSLLDYPKSSSEIAEALGLSKVAVLERLKRLERIGLVRKLSGGRHTRWVKA